jgi:hypothetical protein
MLIGVGVRTVLAEPRRRAPATPGFAGGKPLQSFNCLINALTFFLKLGNHFVEIHGLADSFVKPVTFG